MTTKAEATNNRANGLTLELTMAIAFVYGIAIGSFLNVVIWRLPRGGSIVDPTWSYCPQCEHRLGAIDLFPVVSFLALGAKCRYCHAPISWRYPLIELLTGFLFAAVAWRYGFTWDTLFHCLFVAVLISVFFIDAEHYVIPDGLNVLAIVIGFIHNGTAIALGPPGQWASVGRIHLPGSLVGLVVYGGVLFLFGFAAYVWIVAVIDRHKSIGRAAGDYVRETFHDWAWVSLYYLGALIPPLRRLVEPPTPLEGATAEEIETDEDGGGVGGGDAKLAAAIGANLYPLLALQSGALAVMLGAVVGVFALVRRRRRLGERTSIPFGPAMVGGALIVLFTGPSLFAAFWAWYVARFLSFPGSQFSGNGFFGG